MTDIIRIDSYTDARFSKTALYQHGAYLIGEDPYEVEITGADTAVVRGKDPAQYDALIETFRFHAPHIVRFLDASGAQIAAYPAQERIEIALDRIQPSQFYIDEEKLAAIRTFVHKPEDVVVQVIPYGDRFISLDGHTRLYLAAQRGYAAVNAVVSETDDWVWTFVREAERRNIRRSQDMVLLPHERYEILWNRYCDEVFEAEQEETAKAPNGMKTGG